MFNNGKEAILFYVDARNIGFDFKTPKVSKLDFEGHGTEYDANALVSMPGYTIIVETIIDLEKIMLKTLTHAEIKYLIHWAIYDVEDETIDPRPEAMRPDKRKDLAELSVKYKKELLLGVIVKFEGGLKKYGYLKGERAQPYFSRNNIIVANPDCERQYRQKEAA